MSFQRNFLTSIVLFLGLSLAFLSGYVLHGQLQSLNNDFPLLDQAYTILSNHALNDPPDSPDLEYGMIRGMLRVYGDPYTIFVEPAQHELESNDLQGSFGGIGAHISKDDQGKVILFPFPNGPARRAGIKEGDYLLGVNDLVITPDTPIDTILASIRGPIGEEVRLTVARPPDFATLEFFITRGDISLPSVISHLDPDEPQVGVIKINIIAASTPDEIQEAAADLQASGASFFILDLRDNGGGLVSTGVDTARLFLKEGVIVQQQYRGQAIDTFRVERLGPLSDLPLAVLVNNGTASASEIIAGALKAHGRAKIIGEPTFGKDSIQLVFDLRDGSSLHVTAARWWIPGLEPPLQGNGLQPDVLVQLDANGPDPAVTAAIGVLLQK